MHLLHHIFHARNIILHKGDDNRVLNYRCSSMNPQGANRMPENFIHVNALTDDYNTQTIPSPNRLVIDDITRHQSENPVSTLWLG